MTLDTPVSKLYKIGPAYVKKLNKLGIKTARDLLFHFPHRYIDFSNVIPIIKVKVGEAATVQGKILDIGTRRTPRKKMFLTEAVIEDQSGAIKAVWFNQPFLTKTLLKGKEMSLAGKVNFDGKSVYFSNPSYEALGRNIHTARLVPIYPETFGISSRMLRFQIKRLLWLAEKIPDFLPKEIRTRQNFLELSRALKLIHFPSSRLQAKVARQRLGFDEIFLIQLYVLKLKLALKRKKAKAILFNERLVRTFVEGLPFVLTNSQKIAAWEILKDIEKPTPMNRLLNGDVGSGKTVVATIAALETAKASGQVAFMAPTEVLAKQHFKTLKELLKGAGLNIAILTGSGQKLLGKKTNQILQIGRQNLKSKIKSGDIDILVGTHALIQKDVAFKDLALVIIDEQHRFGIEQRAELVAARETDAKPKRETDAKPVPHFLTMTATPIPRTLALTIYGDLDISTLKELPKGRIPIITKVVAPARRKDAYQFIKAQIEAGRQAFVICPLVEESEKLEVKSVGEEYQKLKEKIFPDLKIAKLHGKLSSREKERIMKDFKAGKTHILVSTSVVEVGIDVPNATVMMIEGADRFGLAQLHQFRGRVGRSTYQSYCFLFTDSPAQKTHQRLRALIKYGDGFTISKKDLQIRGPGDLTGKRQWGIPDLAMATLNDLELVQKARVEAQGLIKEEPELKKYPLLRDKLKKFKQKVHLE